MPKHTTQSLATYAVVGLLFFGAILFVTGADAGYEEPPFAVKAPIEISKNINDTLTTFEMVVTPAIPPTLDPLATVTPKVEEPFYVDEMFGTVSRFPQRQAVLVTNKQLRETTDQNYLSPSQIGSGVMPTDETREAQLRLYNETSTSPY